MEAIPRATPRARTNRERPLVTRHGLRSSHAATPLLRRMRQYTLFTKISATEPNMSRASSRSTVRLAKIALTMSPPTQHRRFAITTKQNRNPHRPSPQPRGFVLGRFSYAGPCLDE